MNAATQIVDRDGNTWELVSVDDADETATYRAHFAWPDLADATFAISDTWEM